MSPANKEKEKAKELAMKQLRQEIEEKLAEQLPAESDADRSKEPMEMREPETSDEAKRVIEAILFSSSKPLAIVEFKRVLKGYSASQIEGLIRELQAEYVATERSFRIIEIAKGFEISTEPKYAPWILKLELQKKARQASQSALETLAILAYKQPMTRAEIEDLRGVDVSGVISTLMERQLVKIVGRKEVPGRPFLYGTTEKFLEHFGLKSIQDLPDISEIKTLIENSIKKDDLLRQDQTIPVSQDESSSAEGEMLPASEASESESVESTTDSEEQIDTE
ncbi:SMC-Scp complex subunit ScpB, partial [candidate division WWE3 bacterium CG_4_9_14_3_um_filter_39_7]